MKKSPITTQKVIETELDFYHQELNLLVALHVVKQHEK